MKLSKNGRKMQKAIRRAVMLGLPVAGLLVTAGCDKDAGKVKLNDTTQVGPLRLLGDVRTDYTNDLDRFGSKLIDK